MNLIIKPIEYPKEWPIADRLNPKLRKEHEVKVYNERRRAICFANIVPETGFHHMPKRFRK